MKNSELLELDSLLSGDGFVVENHDRAWYLINSLLNAIYDAHDDLKDMAFCPCCEGIVSCQPECTYRIDSPKDNWDMLRVRAIRRSMIEEEQ